MMTRAEHYLKAEEILRQQPYSNQHYTMALVHAVLASAPLSVEEEAQQLQDHHDG